MSPLPMAPDDIRRSFNSDGYVHLRGVFSGQEMSQVRADLERSKLAHLEQQRFLTNVATPKAFYLLGDLLSKSELKQFDYIVFDDRVLESVRAVLGPELVYFGDSSVQSGEGFRGFHKDNVDRYDGSKPDWQSDYTLVRVGVYLQDHATHSGGLKIRKGSHRFPSYHRGRALDVKTELGDLLIWSLRTTHSGNNVRLRFAPWLCLHPRLEAKVPPAWKLSEDCERFAVFATFGAPSAHLERYVSHLAGRGEQLQYLKLAGVGPHLEDFLRKKNITWCKPVEQYGAEFQQEPADVAQV